MKNILVFVFSIISYNLFSADAVGLDSKIEQVKVYRQNAEITRTASTKLFAGTQEIVLTNISTYINPNSLQVKIASQGKVTLLSAKYKRNFLLTKKNNPEIENLKLKLENLIDELSWIKDQKEIYKGMEDVMNKNKDLGGNDAGFTPMQVSEMANTYKTKLFEIRKELISLKKEEKTIAENRTKIQSQLNELNAKFNKPSGNIVLLVSSVSPISANFKCTYIVNNAGWSPLYDLRSEGITKDVQLNYKANVHQNTGQDWSSTKVIISTGNPAKNNDRPILTPLYANIYVANYNDSRFGNVINKKTSMPMAVTNMAYETEEVIEFKDAYKYNAQVSENQMSVEFEIEHKQTISADGKFQIIPLESYQLNTEYIYHSVPKLDNGAFLLAKVSNWGQYNLISGKANIFFDGAYVGESHINANVTSDTMLLSMGRDESIVVERKAIKKFTETKFLGPNKKDTYAYEISIKNKKSIPIKIEILDQVPISQNKIITVELEEKGEADYLKKVGKLLWTINLSAGESKKVQFKYSVKYPKDETISGVK